MNHRFLHLILSGCNERILKKGVKAFTCFEECREMTRINAAKLEDKYSQCLADGNELLRFHGTTIACSIGTNGSSSLCSFDQCGLCQILKHGFSTNNQESHGAVGVFTTSTSEKAFESIGSCDEQSLRKCVIVCRVIAGRVHFSIFGVFQCCGEGGSVLFVSSEFLCLVFHGFRLYACGFHVLGSVLRLELIVVVPFPTYYALAKKLNKPILN